MGRRLVERDQLTGIVQAAFGPRRRLRGVARLPGGSKKGVYRLTFNDDTTTILYIWDEAENYWPAAQIGADHADPFSDACGVDLFQASHARLDALGVRTPRLYLIDTTRSHHPADVALVEDLPGETLETLLGRDPRSAQPALARLGATLRVMHEHHGPRLGKLAQVDHGGAAQNRACEQVVLDRALGHLTDAAARVERLAAVRDQLENATHELAAAVRPRTQYGLIHGELGPDHVLIDERGDPVIIDIEGAMFFDIEWEHAFLQMRFGQHYHRLLRASDLDEHRLRFYRLALHLSLVAGPLRLLDGDYPDREPMMQIAESHIERTLGCLR